MKVLEQLQKEVRNKISNDPAWNVMTRLHDEFSKIVEYEKKRATQVFDGSLLLKELPDFIPNPEYQNRLK